jgi:hypothetical protein
MTPVTVVSGMAPYLPWCGAPLDTVPVDEAWGAVSMPTAWGRLVWDVLAARSGPVLEDRAVARMLWPILPGAADGWPDASAVGLTVHRPGDLVTVCGPDGYRDVLQWLRLPKSRHWATAGDLLLTAVEFVVGPLADAVPVHVCAYCGTPARSGRLLGWRYEQSGPGGELFACPACWAEIARGRSGRHLRVVKKGPI